MNRNQWIIIASVLGVVAVAALVWAPASTIPPHRSSHSLPPGNLDPIGSGPSHAILPSEPPVTDSEKFNSLNGDIQTDLKILSGLFELFRKNFPQTGNPVGDNHEITAALTGKNRLHLALIPVDHPAINLVGELCDRWGTPFSFNVQSSIRMEIRSAGPDRKMGTDDDIVLAPQPSEPALPKM